MITYYFRTLKDEAFKAVPEIRNGVWIHCEGASDEELNDLFSKLSLDLVVVEDAQDFFEVPRLERSGGVLYFFTRYPFNEQKEATDTAPILIVAGETFMLTVAQRTVPQFESFFKGEETVYTTQKTKLFLQIMYSFTNSFERQLVRLRRKVHRDRAQVRKIGNREIQQYVNYEHKLNDMIAAVLPTNTALQQVRKSNYLALFPEDTDLMEDLIIDNTQLVESARAVLNTIQNVRNATEAILTNNLNATIRTLTLLTVLLTMPMMIASFYGMNVPLPLSEEPWAFWLIIGTVAVIMMLATWVFKRNEWF